MTIILKRVKRTLVVTLLVGSLVTVTGCADTTCSATCTGCCDARGTCRTDEPWACGSGGATCAPCLVGQGCVQGACVGSARASTLQVSGTNRFAPRSAQGFLANKNGPTGLPTAPDFIAVSDRQLMSCRDPYAPPAEGESVLQLVSFTGGEQASAVVTAVDGGVIRTPVTGFSGLVVSQGTISTTVALMGGAVLNGIIEAPICGSF